MKALLIQPPFHRFMGLEQNYPHLGLAYLGTYLKQLGYDVAIRNLEVPIGESLGYVGYGGRADAHQLYLQALQNDAHPVWQEIPGLLAEVQPDVVGITAKSVQSPSALKVAEVVKGYEERIRVVMGGPHATARPQDFSSSFVDDVICGEGEWQCHRLMNGASGELLPVEPLNKLPIPDRSLFMEDYSLEGLGHMVSTRGCPFQCAFCAQSVTFGRQVRYRSPTNIFREMQYLNTDCGVKDFTFWDDSFTIRHQRVLDLCDLLVVKHWADNWTWQCDTRMDLLNIILVQRMLYAGCRRMSLGVESGSPRILSMVRKGESVEEIKEKAKLLRDARRAYPNFKWRIYLMTGFPTETPDEVRMSWDLAEELQPDRICLSNFVYYPETAIYKEGIEKGWIDGYRWEEHSHQTFTGLAREFAGWVDEYNESRGGWAGWKLRQSSD